VENTGLLKTQVEEALAEFVAGGLITADSFTGLRALLTPSNKGPSNHNAKRKAPAALFGMENAGRWSRVQRREQNLDGAGFLASGRAGVGSLSITNGAAAQAELVEGKKCSARSRLRAARRVESAPSPMKKDPDHNSTCSTEIEALITWLKRGQPRNGDAQLPSCYLSTQKGSAYDKICSSLILASRLLPAVVPCQQRGGRFRRQNYPEQTAASRNQDSTQIAQI